MRPRSGKRAAQDNWLIQKYNEMLTLAAQHDYLYAKLASAEQPKGNTVIHGTDGRIEINGTPIGTITKWSIGYDPAERGKSMKNKHRISALEREVKQLMGTVEQLREQQRSNSSAVRSAIVSIADIQREQSAMNDALRIHAHSISEHSAEHTAQKATPYTSLSAAQRDIRAELASLRTAINEQRAEMQKGDRALGEIITNNNNHAILDKRQAERQLAAVQVQLAGLKEWADLTDTAESEQNERLATLERELNALANKYHAALPTLNCATGNDMDIPTLCAHVRQIERSIAMLSSDTSKQVADSIRIDGQAKQITKLHAQIETLKQVCNGLGARISNLRCNVSTAQYDDMLSKIATLEATLADLQVDRARASAIREATQESITGAQALAIQTHHTVEQLREQLDTPHNTPDKQLYQIDEITGRYVAVEPPVWYSELSALLQSLRSEIDALLDRTNGRVSRTIAQVEQLHDRVEQLRSQTSANLQSLSDSIATNTREIENIQPRLHSHHIGA